jgi:hypothetical protein
MTLDDLMLIPYVANGRDKNGADCYGLVRMARYYLIDREWMPDYTTVDGSDKKSLTNAMLSESSGYKIATRSHGAIAAAWRGRFCIHIAIVVNVDGRQMILESDSDAPYPRIINPSNFESRYTRVVYYDN